MKTETKTLAVSDGTSMQIYVSLPEGQPKAAVLVFQEAWGVNSYIKSIADRLAGEGYVAIAPELFHRTAEAGFAGDYTDFSAVAMHMQALTVEGQQADIRAAYEYAKNELQIARVVSIGFCMGGRASYIANATVPLVAAVSFYGGGIAPALLDRAKDMHGPILFFWGGRDAHITREIWMQIPAALDTAGKEHIEVEMSAADHGFFCDARAAYHGPSAELAWPMVLQFFSQKLA